MSKNIDRSLVWDEEDIGRGVDPEREAVKGQVEKDLNAAEVRNRRMLRNQRLRIGLSIPFWVLVAMLWARILLDTLAGPQYKAYRVLYAEYTDPVLSIFTGYLPVVNFSYFSNLDLGHVVGIVALIFVQRLLVVSIRALG